MLAATSDATVSVEPESDELDPHAAKIDAAAPTEKPAAVSLPKNERLPNFFAS